MGIISKDIGIDLGTSNIRIHIKEIPLPKGGRGKTF